MSVGTTPELAILRSLQLTDLGLTKISVPDDEDWAVKADYAAWAPSAITEALNRDIEDLRAFFEETYKELHTLGENRSSYPCYPATNLTATQG